MKPQSCYPVQTSEDNNSIDTVVELNNEPGLGPTPSLLWGSKSFLQNVSVDGLCNEAAKKLEQEINELNKKQDEEMVLMRKNQEMLVSELSWMRKVMWKYAPTELSRPQNNGSTTRQVSDANSGNEQAI
ncbi:hypothetical protein KY289_001236 [Solanum tuberosum]|nr:hypothetical protein KY289_001236 [Solanum tuberosum]